jgi:hypothetical protein
MLTPLLENITHPDPARAVRAQKNLNDSIKEFQDSHANETLGDNMDDDLDLDTKNMPHRVKERAALKLNAAVKLLHQLIAVLDKGFDPDTPPTPLRNPRNLEEIALDVDEFIHSLITAQSQIYSNAATFKQVFKNISRTLGKISPFLKNFLIVTAPCSNVNRST